MKKIILLTFIFIFFAFLLLINGFKKNDENKIDKYENIMNITNIKAD